MLAEMQEPLPVAEDESESEECPFGSEECPFD